MSYLSRVNYPGPVAGNFAVTFPYVSTLDVHVYLDGVATSAWTWVSPSVINLAAIAGGTQALLIKRITPDAANLHTIQTGSINPPDINQNDLQLLYLIQEREDDIVDSRTAEAAIAGLQAQINNLGAGPFGAYLGKVLYLSASMAAGNTLLQASVLAAAAGYTLVIDRDATLLANTVLTARCWALGGKITTGAFTLSINIDGHVNQPLFLPGDTGAITLTGPNQVAHLGWFGAVSDFTTDDTNAIQRFVNTVCNGSLTGHFNGARSKITAAITFPGGTAGWAFYGDNCYIVQGTNNTPIFNLRNTVSNQQTTGWKIIGRFTFTWTNNQSAANTRAVGILFSTTQNGPGWFDFEINEIFQTNGWFVVGRDVNSVTFNIQWQCSIRNIEGAGQYGGVVDLLTNRGGAGAPEIELDRIYGTFASSNTMPMVQIYSAGSVRLSRIERNAHSGSQPIISVESSTTVRMENIHEESGTYTANTILIGARDCTGVEVDGFEVATPTAAAPITVTLVKNQGTNISPMNQSRVTLMNASLRDNYTAFLGTIQNLDSDGGTIMLGKSNGLKACAAAALPLLVYEGEVWMSQIVLGVQALGAGAALCSFGVPRAGRLVRGTVRLSGGASGSMDWLLANNGTNMGGGAIGGTTAFNNVARKDLDYFAGPAGASNQIIEGAAADFKVGAANTLSGTTNAIITAVFANVGGP